jgi:hypothetical protein
MVISELHKTLQKRQAELISLLENKSDEFQVEKQHQVYGAINELKLVLETLDYYRNKEIINGEKDFELLRTEQKDKIISNIKQESEKKPNLVSLIKQKFENLNLLKKENKKKTEKKQEKDYPSPPQPKNSLF